MPARHASTLTGVTAARTTLGDLHRATPWLWLNCERCQHHAPLACAVAVIRWGPNTSSDKLRQSARCTACGHKGATLQHPGWGGADVGFLPFPSDRLSRRERSFNSTREVPADDPKLIHCRLVVSDHASECGC
jgi:hypothetical protein